MKSFTKRILKLLAVALVAYLSSYLLVSFISVKLQEESIKMNYMVYEIQNLKDIHTLCMLDYTINPNGANTMQECQEIQQKLAFYKKHLQDQTPYWNLIKKITP
ncbi:MAG: hypothetical protein IE909_08580 [Campylobacterales bacterium]|nr:hypothetical protein [Campylobacterales bacterium]